MPRNTNFEFDALLRSIVRVSEPEEETRLEATEQALRRRLAAIFEQPSRRESLPISE